MLPFCRTCLDEITDFNYFILSNNTVSVIIKNQLSLCVPELVLDSVRDPVMCHSCAKALHSAFDFKYKCLQSEERINRYKRVHNLSDIYLPEMFGGIPYNVEVTTHQTLELPEYDSNVCVKNEVEIAESFIKAEVDEDTINESYINNVKQEPVDVPEVNESHPNETSHFQLAHVERSMFNLNTYMPEHRPVSTQGQLGICCTLEDWSRFEQVQLPNIEISADQLRESAASSPHITAKKVIRRRKKYRRRYKDGLAKIVSKLPTIARARLPRKCADKVLLTQSKDLEASNMVKRRYLKRITRNKYPWYDLSKMLDFGETSKRKHTKRKPSDVSNFSRTSKTKHKKYARRNRISQLTFAKECSKVNDEESLPLNSIETSRTICQTAEIEKNKLAHLTVQIEDSELPILDYYGEPNAPKYKTRKKMPLLTSPQDLSESIKLRMTSILRSSRKDTTPPPDLICYEAMPDDNNSFQCSKCNYLTHIKIDFELHSISHINISEDTFDEENSLDATRQNFVTNRTTRSTKTKDIYIGNVKVCGVSPNFKLKECRLQLPDVLQYQNKWQSYINNRLS